MERAEDFREPHQVSGIGRFLRLRARRQKERDNKAQRGGEADLRGHWCRDGGHGRTSSQTDEAGVPETTTPVIMRGRSGNRKRRRRALRPYRPAAISAAVRWWGVAKR